MKFKDYTSKWKEKCMKGSESWKMSRVRILEMHILPYIGEKELTKISPEDISDVLNASKAKGHKERTTKKIYMVMSKIFKDAIDFFEYIKKSPVKKSYHLPYCPPQAKRPYMTLEQAIIFLEYTYGHTLFSVPAWIGTLAGPRISELESLTWEDIDFERNEIRITKSNCIWSKSERNYTKGKNHYTSLMCPMLRAFLWNRRKRTGRVCLNSKGGMMSRWAFGHYLRRVSNKLNFPVKSSHGLRHTCARIHVEMGARDEEIMELLGHKWLVSSKTYTHRDNLDILKNINKKLTSKTLKKIIKKTG